MTRCLFQNHRAGISRQAKRITAVSNNYSHTTENCDARKLLSTIVHFDALNVSSRYPAAREPRSAAHLHNTHVRLRTYDATRVVHWHIVWVRLPCPEHSQHAAP